MKAIITSFRRSLHRISPNHMVIQIDSVLTKDKAKEFIGKEVVYTTESGKELKGKISGLHGNIGKLRVIFETGMPGQSLGKEVKIK